MTLQRVRAAGAPPAVLVPLAAAAGFTGHASISGYLSAHAVRVGFTG